MRGVKERRADHKNIHTVTYEQLAGQGEQICFEESRNGWGLGKVLGWAVRKKEEERGMRKCVL